MARRRFFPFSVRLHVSWQSPCVPPISSCCALQNLCIEALHSYALLKNFGRRLSSFVFSMFLRLLFLSLHTRGLLCDGSTIKTFGCPVSEFQKAELAPLVFFGTSEGTILPRPFCRDRLLETVLSVLFPYQLHSNAPPADAQHYLD